MFYLFPLRKKVAYKNLTIAFPEKSNKDIKKILLKSYQHYGLLMVEFLRQAVIGLNNNLYLLDANTEEILNNEEGFILMTAHIGNWEAMLPIISKNRRMLVVVRDQTNTGGDMFFSKARKFKNITLISKKASKNTMVSALLNNDVLGLASDQNAKDKGISIDFFGKPSSIAKGAGHFHWITKSKIVLGFCILNEQLKYNFKLVYLDFEKNYQDREKLISKINKIYVKKLEEEINKNPEQYFWFHKKWDKSIYDL